MHIEHLRRPRETVTRITGRFTPNVDAAVIEAVREQQTLRSLLTRPRIKSVHRIDEYTIEIRRARMTWAQWRAEMLAVVRRRLGFRRSG
jgi:hypothetical protein